MEDALDHNLEIQSQTTIRHVIVYGKDIHTVTWTLESSPYRKLFAHKVDDIDIDNPMVWPGWAQTLKFVSLTSEVHALSYKGDLELTIIPSL